MAQPEGFSLGEATSVLKLIKALYGTRQVVRYVKGTMDLGLIIQSTPDLDFNNMVTAFTDSDWGKDPSDRKSYSGYVIFVGACLVI
mmetsp:Transcript_37893/g.49881  ORF Transcript_37893/g.49881 Transcript_37893/m.49881 type:complete len:86 (-) Transcript_37893:491-748(-)